MLHLTTPLLGPHRINPRSSSVNDIAYNVQNLIMEGNIRRTYYYSSFLLMSVLKF